MNENKRIYSLRTPLHPFDLDCYGHYPISRLVSLYVEAAAEHATLLGIGERDLMGDACTWILSRLSTVIHAPIDVQKPLDIETGIVRFSGLTSLRAIRATQDEGRRLISTTVTQWAAMGFHSRRPIPMEQILGDREFDLLEDGEWEIPTLPRRVIPDDVELKLADEHVVTYSDLDLNRHFNSSAWISTGLNVLPLEQLRETPSRVDLHFIREAVYEDRLQVLHECTGAEHFIRLTHPDGAPGFEMRITY